MQVRSCSPPTRTHLPTSQTSTSGDTRAHCPTSRSAWCCCPTRLPRRACAACCSPPPRNTMQLPCWAHRYRACARGPRATPIRVARRCHRRRASSCWSRYCNSIAAFITRLCKAYGTALPLAALSDEARLVHTLWQAWHRQLREEDEHDPETAYLAQLRAAIARDDRCTFYLAGYNELAPPEREWAQALASRGSLNLLAQGERVDSAAGETLQGNEDAPHPSQAMRTLLEDWTYTFKKEGMPSPYSTFLDAVYAPRPIAQVTGDDHLFATRARHGARRRYPGAALVARGPHRHRHRHGRPQIGAAPARAARARRRRFARRCGLGLVHHLRGRGAGTLARDARRRLRLSAAHRSLEITLRLSRARAAHAAHRGPSFRTRHRAAREHRA